MAPAANIEKPIYLSKTDFTNSMGCTGFAWLAKHRPHLVPGETDPGAIRRARAGDEVELVARELFPGGVLIDTWDMAEAVALTNAAIAAGATTLFQATVWTARGLLARADILTRLGDRWILSEVKATTSVKKEHVADAAFQTIAFAEAGFDIAETRIIHLNKTYRRRGNMLPNRLLETHNVGVRVRNMLLRIEREIDHALAALQDPDRPAICLCDMGTRSQRCPAFAHFHPDVPSGDTVYDLGSVNGKELGEVLARGIVNLADWPADIRVTVRQRRQIEALRHGAAHIDRHQILLFLDRLEYPLAFLDYETFQTAIPLFDGFGPWAQAPFQYSIHIVDADGSSIEREFLWTEPGVCPAAALVERLRQDIGPTGSVVVWNQGFEESRNREMAAMNPEAAEFLLGVNARMVDLMDVVRKGMWVDPAFNGSASIKKVLPVVEPGLAYELLEIGDGPVASERWFEAVMGEPPTMTEGERLAIFEALREYCRRDSLAMVRIWEHLHELVNVRKSTF